VSLLENQPPHDRLDVEGHLVLAPQRQNKWSPSDHLIHLHLTGEHNDETTIYIAVDDLYLCGFANKSGESSSFTSLTSLAYESRPPLARYITSVDMLFYFVDVI
jgi:hypothetical protein